MAIRMGFWDCESCGTTKIEGPNRNCPNCGVPREDDIKFYTEDNAPEVKDKALLERAKAGGDWTCEYCSSETPATKNECSGCGAPRDGTKGREAKFIPNANAAPPKPAPKPAAKLGAGAIVGCLGVAALAIFGIWFLFLRTVDVGVQVSKKTWVRTVTPEERKWVDKEGWADEVPRASSTVEHVRRITKDRKKRVKEGTERVKTGQKDLGNGMFEDVYETRDKYVEKMVPEPYVYYREMKWVAGKKLQAQCEGDSAPEWPKVKEVTNKLRVGTKTDEIVFALLDPKTKDTYEYRLDVSKAENKTKADKFKVGESYVARITTAGSVTELVPPGGN